MAVLPFVLETPLELRIAEDPDWQAGLDYGKPRRGHPEGAVKFHIADVLANVDRFFGGSQHRADLRLIAILHDTFKYRVDPDRQRSGENHHGMIARRFAGSYITEVPVLEVIETHDEAYNAWQKGSRDGKWPRAEERAARLIARLGETLALYVAFYQCDNATDGKSQEPFEWFLKQRRAADQMPNLESED